MISHQNSGKESGWWFKWNIQTGRKIKFYIPMLNSSLCDHSDSHILVKGTITNTRTRAYAPRKWADIISKQITFKHWAPFTNCISQMNNTQVDNKECLDIVVLTHNLIECSDNFAKTSGGALQYCKDIPNCNMSNSE